MGDDDGDCPWGTYIDSEDGGEEPEAATPGKHILVSILTSGTNNIVLPSGENRLKSKGLGRTYDALNLGSSFALVAVAQPTVCAYSFPATIG